MSETISFSKQNKFVRIDGKENDAALARFCLSLHFAKAEDIVGKTLEELKNLAYMPSPLEVKKLNAAYGIPITMPVFTEQGISNLEAAANVLSELAAKKDVKLFEQTRSRFASKDFWAAEYKECASSGRPHQDVVREMAVKEEPALVKPTAIIPLKTQIGAAK